jgi:ABC-type transport system substrate-binding protein
VAGGGGPVRLTLMSFNSSNYKTRSEYIQAVFNKYRNVKTTIDLAASAVQIGRVNQRNFTLALYSTPSDDPDPTFTDRWICNANPSYTGYRGPKFDAAVQDARETTDPNKRIADSKEAQRLLHMAMPVMFYERRYTYILGKSKLRDFAATTEAMPLWDRMWIKSH